MRFWTRENTLKANAPSRNETKYRKVGLCLIDFHLMNPSIMFASLYISSHYIELTTPLPYNFARSIQKGMVLQMAGIWWP
jgi:hypothetical protein